MSSMYKYWFVLILVMGMLAKPIQAQQTCNGNLPEATPATDFSLSANGTALHNTTDLMWMRCALGQSWNGVTCTGTASSHTWQDALTHANNSTFAGFNDWRLPNIKELSSILETQCISPSINTTVFLATPSTFFWSSSSTVRDTGLEFWTLHFDDGVSGVVDEADINIASIQVRLVRGGQLFDAFNSRASTTAISSDTPDPSDVGQAVTVAFTVTSAAGTPTGEVTVNVSTGESCAATVAEGSCEVTFVTAGARTLTASYAGDANFDPSVSADEPHTVNMGDIALSITSDDPDPSLVGEAVTVAFTVTSAVGMPTGDVVVNADTGESCTAALSAGAGSCEITFASVGARTLTASYVGDANYPSGDSAVELHTVNAGDTTISITGDDPDPSMLGESVTVSYSVIPTTGTETPTGGGTINADSGESCTATVATGSCELTFAAAGAKTLTASYEGDANFDPSVSAEEPHTVDENIVPIPTLSPMAMLLLMGLLVLLALCRRGVRL